MAAVIYLYDVAVSKIVDDTHSVGDTYKVELLNNSATFTASDTTKAAVDNSGAYEVTSTEWVTGGPSLTSVVKQLATTNDAVFDAADVDVTASTDAIGPAYNALIYNSTDNTLLAFISFGEAKTADVGTHFIITWPTTGIVNFGYTSP